MLSGLPVNSSHSHLVTRSCRHTVNSSPVNSSQTRLITQSTRHKRAHDKTTSTSRNYLHDVRRYPETVLNTDGVITTISVTLMYATNSRSRRQITLLRKAWSTRHNAVKHDGQLVTRFYNVTSWPCDKLTGSQRNHLPRRFQWFHETVFKFHKSKAWNPNIQNKFRLRFANRLCP